MAKLITHYDNLKVTRDAPLEVIRAAYKVLAQKHHPDRHDGDANASRITKILNASYAVLSDPIKRQAHDVWIAQQELSSLQTKATESRQTQRPQPKPQPHAEKRPEPDMNDEAQVMARYGISRDGQKFACGTYRFDKLSNAVAHARHVESLRRGP